MVRYALLMISILFMQNLCMAQEKPTLIYIGDPMCSWCYGFSPELDNTMKELGDELTVRLILGGLRPYNDEKISDMKVFLQEHWEHVNEASGQNFDYTILDDPTFVYDTEPPSRAVLVVRHLMPESEFAFFHDVQKLFYQQNKHTDVVENYYPILEKYGIDKFAFTAAYNSEEIKQLIKEDFAASSALGVSGFPSMLLLQDGKYKQITNGYTKSDDIIKSVLKQIK